MSQTHQRKLHVSIYYQLKEIKKLVSEEPKVKTKSKELEIHEHNKSFMKALDVHAKACWRYTVPVNAICSSKIHFRQNGLNFKYELRPKDFCRFTSRGIEVMLCRLIKQLYLKKNHEQNQEAKDENYKIMKALIHLRCITRHVAETIDDNSMLLINHQN